MDITEEMLSAYRAGRHEHRIRDAHLDGPNALGGECCDRAGLAGVAPLIAAQAALAERVKIVADVRRHADRAARTLGSSRAASTAVAAIANEVADLINTLPSEDDERKCPGCGHAKRWHVNGRCAGDLLCCSCTDAP